MNLGLKDSVALVTGSSSGIGKAAAIAFGREGARVAVTYHSNRRLGHGFQARTLRVSAERGVPALLRGRL